MKKLVFAFLFTCTFLSTTVSAHHNDQDYVCTDVEVETRIYSGWASCLAWDENNIPRTLTEFVSRSYTPSVYISQYTFGEWLSCWANVPYSHTETSTREVCNHVPREPYVSWANYEYGACRYYTRHGFITWQGKTGATNYEVQEQSGTRWNSIYSGTRTAMSYTKSPGQNNKTYRLRVRTKSGSQTGSWKYFSAMVPKCWNGGGPHPR